MTELAFEYPYTVIDTPGSFSTISQLVIDIADVVIVPTGFDWLDGKGGKETVPYINKRRPKVPIVVVPNKFSKNLMEAIATAAGHTIDGR